MKTLRRMLAVIALLAAMPAAAVPGLVGTYFNNTTLTTPAALVRVDANLQFIDLAGSPDPVVNGDNWSARWVGVLRVPTTGSYTFSTLSNDGVRLRVNGTLLIDHFTAHPVALDTSAPVNLTAGVDYPIVVEYFDINLLATLHLLWQRPGDLVPSTIPASDGTSGLATSLTPAIELRFEEASWNGTAGEAIDTSTSGWHARAAGLATALPTPANATPAVGTIAGTCGYGQFERAGKEHVLLPTAFQNLGSTMSFTATAWIRPSDVSLAGQRVFVDDENGSTLSTAGYGLTLGDAGTGTLRFYTRATTANRNLDTGNVVAANVWTFVAFSVDLATRTKRLAVYDASGTQLASVSSTFVEANIGSDAGPASVGGETNAALGGQNTTSFGFGGDIDEVRVYPWAMGDADLAAVRALAPPCPAIIARTPGRFNAFESTTAAASITGAIHTKVAGSAFGVDVVAIDLTGTAVLPGFTGTVRVELLDASNNAGALDAASNCRASWSPIVGNAGATLAFASLDAGRRALAGLLEAEAWRELRLRISYPAIGTATAVGCSTDAFAVRPAAFTAPVASDGDALTAGSARSLANTGATGGVVHKAGRPFRLGASAVNAAGTPAVTTRYTGTPGATLTACAGSGCTAGVGVMSVGAAAVAGVIASNAASYSEAGSVNLQLVDSSWAAVDAADGSTAAERNVVSPVVAIGRFVPDHFDLASMVTPVLRTFGTAGCASRSFTYVGQPFGWATAPQASVIARNAGGATTALYAGALWKLGASGVTQTYTPDAAATPGLDTTGLQAATLTSNGNGTGVLRASSSDALRVVRPPAAPIAPFDASFGLSWSVTDASEAAVTGNGSIVTTTPLAYAPLAFDAGAAFRYGVLRFAGAYGSELVDLVAPVAGAASAPQPAASAAAADAEAWLYRHGVQITVQGSYADMQAYLAAIERLPRRVFWGTLTIDAQAWPASVMTVTLYTVSLERTWWSV